MTEEKTPVEPGESFDSSTQAPPRASGIEPPGQETSDPTKRPQGERPPRPRPHGERSDRRPPADGAQGQKQAQNGQRAQNAERQKPQNGEKQGARPKGGNSQSGQGQGGQGGQQKQGQAQGGGQGQRQGQRPQNQGNQAKPGSLGGSNNQALPGQAQGQKGQGQQRQGQAGRKQARDGQPGGNPGAMTGGPRPPQGGQRVNGGGRPNVQGGQGPDGQTVRQPAAEGQPGQPDKPRPPQQKRAQRPAGAARPAGAPQADAGGAQRQDRQRPPRPAVGRDGETRPPRPARPESRPPRPAAVTAKPEVREEPEEVYFQYRVHELKKRPKTAFLLVAAMLVVGYASYSAYPQPMFVAVSLGIMVFSVSYFLFPITYRFSNRGVYMRNLLSNEFRAWDKFYDYHVYPDAVQLLFDYRTLRGRVQKGYLVYFAQDPSLKDKLVELVKSRIKKPEKVEKPGAPAKVRQVPQTPQVPQAPVKPAVTPGQTGLAPAENRGPRPVRVESPVAVSEKPEETSTETSVSAIDDTAREEPDRALPPQQKVDEVKPEVAALPTEPAKPE